MSEVEKSLTQEDAKEKSDEVIKEQKIDTSELLSELKQWLKSEVIPQIIANNKQQAITTPKDPSKSINEFTIADIDRLLKGD